MCRGRGDCLDGEVWLLYDYGHLMGCSVLSCNNMRVGRCLYNKDDFQQHLSLNTGGVVIMQRY